LVAVRIRSPISTIIPIGKTLSIKLRMTAINTLKTYRPLTGTSRLYPKYSTAKAIAIHKLSLIIVCKS